MRLLQKEWERHPPADWLVASYLGYKPPAEEVRVRPMPRPVPQPQRAQIEAAPPLPAGPSILDGSFQDAIAKIQASLAEKAAAQRSGASPIDPSGMGGLIRALGVKPGKSVAF